MENNKDLSDKQIGAIRRGINLGRTLQRDHPEIAELYRNKYMPQIVKELDIQSRYGVSESVACNGIRHAIVGHDGSFKIEAYGGLISEEEGERIGREHKFKGGRKVYEEGRGIHRRTAEQRSEDGKISGYKTYEQEIGIHGRTAEQHSEDGRKGGKIGGKISGRKTYEKRVGVHGRTAEQMSEDARKSVIARGQTPWRDEEKEFAYQLSLNSEYKTGSRINNQLIAVQLNKKFHEGDEVRNARIVSTQLCRYKKSLENIVSE